MTFSSNYNPLWNSFPDLACARTRTLQIPRDYVEISNASASLASRDKANKSFGLFRSREVALCSTVFREKRRRVTLGKINPPNSRHRGMASVELRKFAQLEDSRELYARENSLLNFKQLRNDNINQSWSTKGSAIDIQLLLNYKFLQHRTMIITQLERSRRYKFHDVKRPTFYHGRLITSKCHILQTDKFLIPEPYYLTTRAPLLLKMAIKGNISRDCRNDDRSQLNFIISSTNISSRHLFPRR